MTEDVTLAFAVVGHPNEGKSSVVATLVEDDTIRISPWPGETRKQQAYPMMTGGKVHLSFIDTPGFQSPIRMLAGIQNGTGAADYVVESFIKDHKTDPDFADEREIMQAISTSTGLIYVVDASRPLRKTDLAEMEILRLTGCPRMAVINAKSDSIWLEDWKIALRKTFNAVRVFNAVTAGYTERIRLLTALKSMDSDVELILTSVVRELERDWEERLLGAAQKIVDLLFVVSVFRVEKDAVEKERIPAVTETLLTRWQEEVCRYEADCWAELRRIFRHHRFAPQPAPVSVLKTDLLAKESFRLFGFSRAQLAVLSGGTAAAIGAGVDVALGGAALGLVTAASGAAGAAWSYLGTRNTDVRKIAGVKVSGVRVGIGPVQDDRLPWMMLDRVLVLCATLITRAHAVRKETEAKGGESVVSRISMKDRKEITGFLAMAKKKKVKPVLRNRIDLCIKDLLSRLATGHAEAKEPLEP